MNLGNLIDIFRKEVFDTVQPYLWSDAEVAEYANDAVMEAVRRGYQIIDSSTAEIVVLPYYANRPVLELDPRIIVIRSAIVRGQLPALERQKVTRMDALWPGWRTHSGLRPTAYLDDWASYQIRLYPTPTQSGVIELSVAREPLDPMVRNGDEPELPARYHRNLINWMKYRAYNKADAETQNLDKAALAEKAFAAEFGDRKSARNEKWQEEQAGVMFDTLA